jgi:pilus assembly protein CpaE
MRILLIEDELFYYKLIAPELKKAGYELKYVRTGKKGLDTIPSYKPDMLIVDLRLPDIDGFEIVQRLRNDPEYNHIPVIFITTQNSLENKLKAFDLGADDYLVKPFQPEELVARLGILARRGKIMRFVQELDEEASVEATSLAVHSLRGGVGLSSLALNLSFSFQEIWVKRTLLVDAVLAAGQVAVMLNATPRTTWESMIDIPEDEIDDELINELICQKSDRISYVAAPRNPLAGDSFTPDFWRVVLAKIKTHSRFLVFDTAHDFSDTTISVLTNVQNVLLVVTPDMASLRAAVSALEVYDKIGVRSNQVKLVLNHTNNIAGIRTSQLEKVFGREIDYVLPYVKFSGRSTLVSLLFFHVRICLFRRPLRIWPSI